METVRTLRGEGAPATIELRSLPSPGICLIYHGLNVEDGAYIGDEFVIYDALPGIPMFEPSPSADEPPAPKRRTGRTTSSEPPEPPDAQVAATGLLTRALRIGLEKEVAVWLHNSAVKAQMKRMDPSFSEKSLGFRSFSDFLRSRSDVVELDESSTTRMVRLRDKA